MKVFFLLPVSQRYFKVLQKNITDRDRQTSAGKRAVRFRSGTRARWQMFLRDEIERKRRTGRDYDHRARIKIFTTASE